MQRGCYYSCMSDGNHASQESFIPHNPHFCYVKAARRTDEDAVNAKQDIAEVRTIAISEREPVYVVGLCPFHSLSVRRHGSTDTTLPMGRCQYLNKNDEDFKREGQEGKLYRLEKMCGENL